MAVTRMDMHMLIGQYKSAVEDLARAQQAFDEVENKLLAAVNELLPLKPA